MASNRTTRLLALTTANTLLLVAVLLFATGFFPYKPVLPGLATLPDHARAPQPPAPFKRIIFMVVDALRSDFVYSHNSHMAFTQSLIRDGSVIPFTAHATPPTVTMPRVKALTTGSVPSFLDLILNFAEADTSSSLSGQDTWLAQLRERRTIGAHGSGKGEKASGGLVFYGDDTWLKLFPQSPSDATDPFFKRSDGTSSFFVSVSQHPKLVLDFTEVDTNVTRHLPAELLLPDWDGLVMHYLGLDHIGHKTGPQGPAMPDKQREMDDIVRSIYSAIEQEPDQADTLLVLAGDHGMNAGGNHGGSGPGETEPALLFASPKFKALAHDSHGEAVGFLECPTTPKKGTEFHFYRKVEQSDLVPSLAGLLGLPVSRNSLGVFARELLGFWSEEEQVRLLVGNAWQVLGVVRAAFGGEGWDAEVEEWKGLMGREGGEGESELSELAFKWAKAEAAVETGDEGAKEELLEFLYAAQEVMSSTASSYDIPRMLAGIVLTLLALTLTLFALPSLWPPNPSALFLSTIILLYGLMVFASSYVEEEQQFWFWTTPAWLTNLTLSKLRTTPTLRTLLAGTALLILHRFSIRWNQTGQKHSGSPDIVSHFFPAHHIFMWVLVLASYGLNALHIARYSLSDFLPAGFAASLAAMIFVPSVLFKLNFTQADAPELVQDVGRRLREWSVGFDLVVQARVVFILLGIVTGLVLVLPGLLKRLEVKSGGSRGSELRNLAERLHPLLTMFLVMQTRAPNVPLFMVVEGMRWLLGYLLERSDGREKAVSVATSVLLLSNVYYFCMGGSNSISSIDLSNAYNGVADYNIVAVGVLLFVSNWAGPVWWCSAAVLLLSEKPSNPAKPETNGGRDWINAERAKLREDAVEKKQDPDPSTTDDDETWQLYLICMTAFIAGSILAVMAACTALRTHLFIWTVFSPKYLYAMAWAVAWHLLVNCGLGSLLWWIASVA